MGRAAAPTRRRSLGDPPRPSGRDLRLRGEVSEMAFLASALVTVALVALAYLFAADSRPGIDEPPTGWFGRR